jgi:hypothetical protein
LKDDLYNRRLSARLTEIATEGREAVINGYIEPEVIDAESTSGNVTITEATGTAEITPADDAEEVTTEAMGIAAAPADLPKGAVAGTGESDCEDGYPIKGNASSMIYHVPGSSSYERTIPEMCFASEDDAVAAGFRPSKSSVKVTESES